MTDAELIKAVAEKLGWKFHPKNPNIALSYNLWAGPKGERIIGDIDELPPWLTSVDAALSVLDKSEADIDFRWLSREKEWRIIYKSCYTYNESLPRAICEAFLQAPKEKP